MKHNAVTTLHYFFACMSQNRDL